MSRKLYFLFALIAILTVSSCGTQRTAVGHGTKSKGCNCGF